MRQLSFRVLFGVAAATLLAEGVAQARDVVVQNSSPRIKAMSDAELLALPPVVNPLQPPDVSAVKADQTAGPNAKGAMGADGATSSRAFGTFGIPYTTTRVQAGNQSAAGATTANHLSTTYPYRTVGKLSFDQGYCSASLIRRSVIVTAAHCIQNFGSGTTIFTNFRFRPGHYGATGATAAQSSSAAKDCFTEGLLI